MPSTVLEAMACGLPVISTDVGSLSLLIEPEWLVPIWPDEKVIEQMNKKLDLLSKDKKLRQFVGNRNRQFVEKYFSWDTNQSLWDDVFEAVYDNESKKITKLANDFLRKISIKFEPEPYIPLPEINTQAPVSFFKKPEPICQGERRMFVSGVGYVNRH
jgi:hypothetical protein